MFVIRIYVGQNGNQVLQGNVPEDALAIRSGAAHFLTYCETKWYAAPSGAELLENLENKDYLSDAETKELLDKVRNSYQNRIVKWKE